MACKLPLKNSPLQGGGEKRRLGNQSLQYQNSSHSISSNHSAKPGEAGNSRKFAFRNSNYGQRTDRGVTGISGIDRSTNRLPVDDELEVYEDWMCRDDEYDSDDLSVETAKKSKWLRDFFELLNSLSIDQINDPTTKLCCPACKNGVGATAWYNGFQGVLKHAEDVRSRRVRLHQKFAEILREELRNQGGSKSSLLVSDERVVSSGWKGLGNETDDHLIVWPPMVILQNTRSHKDEKGKWVGVGSSELRNCFKHYDIRRVHNAYGPGGHCGISLLIFDSSLNGYLEAERLHKQFLKKNRGKHAWETYRGKKSSPGEFLLYGLMVTEDEMESFNKNSKGKQKQKYEMKSYKLMIINPLKSMEEKLISLEKIVSSGMEENKILTETCNAINRKHQLRGNDIEKLRKMATHQWEESKTEMDYLEKYYEDIINKLRAELEESEIERKKLLKPFHSSGCNDQDSDVEDYNH